MKRLAPVSRIKKGVAIVCAVAVLLLGGSIAYDMEWLSRPRALPEEMQGEIIQNNPGGRIIRIFGDHGPGTPGLVIGTGNSGRQTDDPWVDFQTWGHEWGDSNNTVYGPVHLGETVYIPGFGWFTLLEYRPQVGLGVSTRWVTYFVPDGLDWTTVEDGILVAKPGCRPDKCKS